MARVEMNMDELNNIVGGSICFNEDHTMCGLNCNNQARVNDYASFIAYIKLHMYDMKEGDMLKYAVSQGWITRV